jgi:hypothetical protein
MQGQVGMNENSEVGMEIPATPKTTVETNDGAIDVIQDQHGDQVVVYFAPEIALVVAQEMIRQANAVIGMRLGEQT